MPEWEEIGHLTRAERLARVETSHQGLVREVGGLRETISMHGNRLDAVSRSHQDTRNLANWLLSQHSKVSTSMEWIEAHKIETQAKAKLDGERHAYRKDAIKMASMVMTLAAGVLYLLGAFDLERLKGFASIAGALGK